MFFEATAVLMAELFKLVSALLLVFNDEGRDTKKFFTSLYQTIWVNKFDTLKVSLNKSQNQGQILTKILVRSEYRTFKSPVC